MSRVSRHRVARKPSESKSMTGLKVAGAIVLVVFMVVVRFASAIMLLQEATEPKPEVTAEQISKAWNQYEWDRYKKALDDAGLLQKPDDPSVGRK